MYVYAAFLKSGNYGNNSRIHMEELIVITIMCNSYLQCDWNKIRIQKISLNFTIKLKQKRVFSEAANN